MRRIMMLVAMLMATSQAYALEHVDAKVTLLEATYMPTSVAFMLSEGTAACPANNFLFWSRSAENNKAVYAMLMAAMISGKKIQVVFNDADSSCIPQYLHLVE